MAILMAMLMVRGAGACHVNSWQEQHRMVLAAAKVGAAPKSSTSAVGPSFWLAYYFLFFHPIFSGAFGPSWGKKKERMRQPKEKGCVH